MDVLFFESVLLKFLYQNKDAREKILPFLDATVFTDFNNKEIAKSVISFMRDYKKFPTSSDMKLHIKKEEVYNKFLEILNMDISEYASDSLVGEVEKFFRKKLIWNAISIAAEKLKDDKVDEVKGIPDEIREAISFSFDTQIGLDFVNDAERLYESLHNLDKVIPSGLPVFDKMIGGGFHEKSLTLFMAETNLGKTLIKCGISVNAFLQNKNILYITLEMSEDKISERIMANTFDIAMDELKTLSKSRFISKFVDIRKRFENNFIIKEYPTRSVNTNHIRNLLKELEVRKKFVPDIIFVDYLGIMMPTVIRKDENSYTEVKRISEELRGLAVETGLPIVSAVQTNRGGFSSADLDLTDISDSIGTAATADVIVGVTQSAELKLAGKFSFIILKNRYGLNWKKTVIDVDYSKMRITQSKEEDKKTPAVVTDKTIVDDASVAILNRIKDDKKTERNKIIKFE